MVWTASNEGSTLLLVKKVKMKHKDARAQRRKDFMIFIETLARFLAAKQTIFATKQYRISLHPGDFAPLR